MIHLLLRLDQVVYAKTDMAAHSKGITAFIIEKDMPGYDSTFLFVKVHSYGHLL